METRYHPSWDHNSASGSYFLLGLQAQFHDSDSSIQKQSYSGILVFDGAGGLSGSLEEWSMEWDWGFTTRKVDSRPVSVDGSTYTVSPTGDLEIRGLGDGAVRGHVSASGGLIVIHADSGEDHPGDEARGLLIGFRLPENDG